MKVLIFIEHDVAIRHFVQSRVFADLITHHSVLFVFPEPGYKRVTQDVSKLDLRAPYRHLTVHQERLTIWKRLFQVDMLRWRADPLFRALRILHREMIGWKAAVLYTVLGLPGVFQVFRKRSLGRIKKIVFTDLEQLLAEEKPDMMIHPSVLEGVYINDLVEASNARDIPLVVIMNSWDNPSTKRAMVGKPDWLLVWGQQTWQHAVDFVGTPPERTIKFGAAQFEVYRTPPRVDRQGFCANHDIDPNDTLLLYAGSSKGTDEFSHLRRIEDAVADGQYGPLTVVYRPHPWGLGGKGGERILDHPWKHVRIESSMRAYLEGVRDGNTAMTFPDYKDTHDVLSCIDVLVSPLSTILLEGALHGKPSLCFLPMEETDARHFQLALPLKHFEDMFNMPEFLVSKGIEELIPSIKVLLANGKNQAFKDRLPAICRHFVEPFDAPYGERLTAFCEAVVNGPR